MIARLVLVAFLATGCLLDERSGDFVCTGPTECGPGRTCVDGWCILATGDGGTGADARPTADAPPTVDAPPPADADPFAPDAAPPDAMICPPACSSCDALGFCVINCAAASSCPTLVVCPAGIPCKVECSGDSSCAAGIDCNAATSCIIECTNTSSCAGLIDCGNGRCRVECGGGSACVGGVNCLDACQCDTFCTGAGSCTIPPVCPPAPQCDTGLDCTSIPGPCNSC